MSSAQCRKIGRGAKATRRAGVASRAVEILRRPSLRPVEWASTCGLLADQTAKDRGPAPVWRLQSWGRTWHTPELLALAAKLPLFAIAGDHQKLADTRHPEPAFRNSWRVLSALYGFSQVARRRNFSEASCLNTTGDSALVEDSALVTVEPKFRCITHPMRSESVIDGATHVHQAWLLGPAHSIHRSD